jgi:ribosome modulation factor
LLPRSIHNKQNRNTPELEQENKDAAKLGNWKNALKGQGKSICSDEVRDYLDEHLEGWRTEINFDEKAIEDAKAIVLRKNQRPNLLPRSIRDKENRNTPELEQENKDAVKLGHWKKALKGQGKSICSDEVRDYLDEHLKGWRTIAEEKPPKPKKSMKLKEITTKEPKETPEQRQTRTKSELSVLHQRYKTLTSQNLQKEFQETPDLWHQYHAISEENEKSFPEESIPRNRIIQELTEIKGKRTRSVVDMGCGKAQIADHFANDNRFSFINYDHVSSKENVLVQDISKTGLEDNSVEICILCLAMWGSNCHDYVREAYRILESGGKLYIMEATKRWTDDEPADKLKKLLEETGFQIVEQSIEKFCMFICIKI